MCQCQLPIDAQIFIAYIQAMNRIKRSKLAIETAGGQACVARACRVSQPTVWGWTRSGIPRTDWTGETNYSAVIERLVADADPGNKITREWILNGENTHDFS